MCVCLLFTYNVIMQPDGDGYVAVTECFYPVLVITLLTASTGGMRPDWGTLIIDRNKFVLVL